MRSLVGKRADDVVNRARLTSDGTRDVSRVCNMLRETGEDVVGASSRACDRTDDLAVGVSIRSQTGERTQEIGCLRCCRRRARKTVRGIVGLRYVRHKTGE